MKRIGTVLALAGGILSFFIALTYFFSGKFMGGMDYNRIDYGHAETVTYLGVIIFIIAIAVLFLALLAFKHHYSQKLFISLIILGALLIVLTSYLGGVLTLAGGILGTIGVLKATDKKSHHRHN